MPRSWTVEELLNLARAFQGACVLTAAADLDVFTALASRRQGAKALASKLRADARATATLLDALAAMGLLVKRGATYAPAPGVAEALSSSSPANVLAMTRHSGTCLRRWAQLATVVKTGRPAEGYRSIRDDAADCEAFIEAMDNVSAPIAPGVVRELGPPPFKHLLDVGGGPATWMLAFLRAVPGSTGTLFDLPQVIPLARRHIAAAGLLDRVRLVGGDYTKDRLPRGADLAWVSAIIHQESLGGATALFKRVHAALEPGGRILIRDLVMDASRTRPPMGALFAVNMLVATEKGGTYTFREIAGALRAAGFVAPRLLRKADDMSSVVGARRPR